MEDGSVALASGHHSIDQTNNRLPPTAWQQHRSRRDSGIGLFIGNDYSLRHGPEVLSS